MSAEQSSPLDNRNDLWPVYEFRPLPDSEYDPWLRYADGAWVEDDGEYDICFINRRYGPPICLYVRLPYQKNILWSWCTRHWSRYEPLHAKRRDVPGNPWHYSLRDGAKTWGGDWNRDRHPNEIVSRTGMDYLCSQRGCANGRGVEFHLDDPYIKLGLLRERDTKKIVVAPERPTCMYCGTKWAEQKQAA